MLLTAVIWVVMFLFTTLMFAASAKKTGGALAVPQLLVLLMTVAVVAAPFVIIAGLIPTVDSVVVDLVLWPIGHFLLLILVANLWQRRKKRQGSAGATGGEEA